VADYHEREEEVERLARESKERLEEALSERDQALAREQLLQKEVDRLTDERRLAAVKRQEDIDATLEGIRQRAQTQKKGAEDDLKALAVRNAELVIEAEKSIREAKSYREQLERMHRLREDERKGVDQHVHDLEDKVAKVTAGYEEEKTRREEVQDANKDLRSLIDKLRAQMDGVRVQVQQAEKGREAELLTAKATARDVQRQLVDRTRQLSRKTKEMDDVKAAYEAQLASLERKYQEEAAMYRKRSAESDRLARDLELMKSEGDKQATMMVEEVKAKSVSAQRVVEARLKEEAEAAKRVAAKKREVEDALREANEEKAMYAALLEKTMAEKERVEEELTDVRAEVVHLQEQSSNHGLMVASALGLGGGSSRLGLSAYDESKSGDYVVDAIIGAGPMTAAADRPLFEEE